MHTQDAPPKNDFLKALDEEERAELEAASATDPAEAGRKRAAAERVRAAGRQRVFHLEEQVRVWSDYLPCYLHPRTVHEIQAYQHGGDEMAFRHYGQGRELLRSAEEVWIHRRLAPP